MACSSGDATVSEMVFGFAPGYDARTTMVGGTTSGYSLIGNRHIAIKPTRKMIAESTPAKIGRRMKKWENFILGLRWKLVGRTPHPDPLPIGWGEGTAKRAVRKFQPGSLRRPTGGDSPSPLRKGRGLG